MVRVLPATLKPPIRHFSGTCKMSREDPAGSATGAKQSEWAGYREAQKGLAWGRELRAGVSPARQSLVPSHA